MKAASRERQLYQSTLSSKTAFAQVDARPSILLNRQALSPELVFSSIDPLLSPFDAFESTRWHAVTKCFYSDRHRYTRVFWNQSDVAQNTNFVPVEGQDKLKSLVKSELVKKELQERQRMRNPTSKSPTRVGARQGSLRLRLLDAPVIIVGGRVHPLVDARVYASLLWLNEVTQEAVAQRNGGAADMVKFGKNLSAKQTQEFKQVQEDCMKTLKDMDEAQIREALCQIAEERLREEDLVRMSDLQLSIASDFEQMHWERMVDAKLSEEVHPVTTINPQPYRFVDDI